MATQAVRKALDRHGFYEDTEIELRLLLEAIYLKYRSDFRAYSMSSVRRRVALALEYFQLPSILRLQNLILQDSAAYDRLMQYLTVPTSEMFRDPTYYRALREKVVPILHTYPSIKVWIAGCSTGEELYSFAILLKEEGLLDRALIYATDINPQSLKRAANGIFTLEEIRKYTKNYQHSGGTKAFSDYYTIAMESAVFDPTLRANVVFADHSLVTDSVFAEAHLISCRNVLIYFNRDLQNDVFRLLHDSLAHRGFLGIGSKETLRFSNWHERFEDFVPAEKIYRRKGTV